MQEIRNKSVNFYYICRNNEMAGMKPAGESGVEDIVESTQSTMKRISSDLLF
jgi:hypothetical protein